MADSINMQNLHVGEQVVVVVQIGQTFTTKQCLVVSWNHEAIMVAEIGAGKVFKALGSLVYQRGTNPFFDFYLEDNHQYKYPES